MLARYLHFVHEQPSVAIIRLATDTRLHASVAGARLMTFARATCEIALDRVLRTGRLASFELHGTTYWSVPLFAPSGVVDAALLTDESLETLPSIIHRIQSPTRHFAQIVHLLPEIVMTARPNGTIDFVSRRWSDLFDLLKEGEDPHRVLFAAMIASQRDGAVRHWNDGIASKADFAFDVRMNAREGTWWFRLSARPWSTTSGIIKWSVALTNIDEMMTAREDLERSQGRLRLSADLGRVLASDADPAVIANAVVRQLHTWSGQTSLVDVRDGAERIVSASHPSDRPPLDIIAILAETAGDEPVFVRADLCIARFRGIDGLAGFVALAGSSLPDDPEDLQLLGDVANRLGVAMAESARRRRERRVTDALQRAMLPTALPHVPGVTFDVAYVPAASEMLIGGDWYDAFVAGDGRIGIAIGDVAGHGLAAAIVMNDIRRAIRTPGIEGLDPAQILHRANAVALREEHPMTTAFVGLFDPLTLKFHYACAGHPPPFYVSRDGAITRLQIDGPPLGVTARFAPRTRQLDLSDDAALVLYTDGVIEADRNITRAEARFAATLRDWSESAFAFNAEALQRRVIGEVDAADDAATFVIRFHPRDKIDLTFAPTAIESNRVRTAVEHRVKSVPLERERAEDFVLAVGEALNAARHGRRADDATLRLRAYASHAGAFAEIEDRGVERAEAWNGTGSPDRLPFLLMEALTDWCDVRRDESRTVVHLGIYSSPEQRAAFHSAG